MKLLYSCAFGFFSDAVSRGLRFERGRQSDLQRCRAFSLPIRGNKRDDKRTRTATANQAANSATSNVTIANAARDARNLATPKANAVVAKILDEKTAQKKAGNAQNSPPNRRQLKVRPPKQRQNFGQRNCPQKTYKIADEAQPGYPEELARALRKLTVAPPPASMKAPDKARVQITTSKGVITVELNGKAAPLHVKSFLYLSQKGFYNGTTFHRYVPGFVIQGGDPLSKTPNLRQMAGAGGPGYRIPREYNSLKHNAMVLAMARTADPDSAGSQFYFTLEPQFSLDKENSQDGFGYTVFGKVLKGQDVVLKLRQDDVLKRVIVLK